MLTKFQVCRFRKNELSGWESGLAQVKEFGVAVANYILARDGQIFPEVWDYRLMEGPLCYLEIADAD